MVGRSWPSRIATVILVGALAGTAAAGEPTVEEKAGARAAAEQGNSAFKNGKFSEALDLFQRAESLVHAPTHLLMIARTHLALGHLVAAKEAFLQVGRDTLPATAPPPFKKAQVDARAELATLDPRIPTIQVSARGGGSRRIEITMDGKAVPEALVGIARPVDPGQHTLRATADGMRFEDKTVTIQEKDHATVVLELSPATAAPPPVAASPAAPGPEPSPTAEPTATPPPATENSGSSPLRPISIAVIGLGVAGLGVGAVFAILGISKRSDANDAYAKCGDPCPAGPQADAVQELDDEATSRSRIAVIALIAGGALTAGGIVMFAVSGSSNGDASKASSRPEVSPWIGLGSAGVAGRF